MSIVKPYSFVPCATFGDDELWNLSSADGQIHAIAAGYKLVDLIGDAVFE